MLLQEVSVGSKVTILVTIAEQKLSFETVVEEPSEDGVLTEPIYRNEKLIGFRSKGLSVSIQVTNALDQKVYEFSEVDILNVKTMDEEIHHKMICKVPGKQINRRSAIRVWLGIDGIAQFGTNRTPIDVFVKDISITGISFVLQKDLNVDMGTLVHVVFNDAELRMKFNISSIVVRKSTMDGGNVLYGCRMNQESQAIAQYINLKQREKLKGSRTVGTTKPLKDKR